MDQDKAFKLQTKSTHTSFMDLNYDCLFEIISTDCLTAIDLCSIADTNTYLKEIVNDVFTKRYKNCNLRSLVQTIPESRRLLFHFGWSMTQIYIDGGLCEVQSTHLLKSAIRYCSKSLKSLELYSCLITKNVGVSLGSLFVNLRKLHLIDCFTDGDVKVLFANCESLVELKVDGFLYKTGYKRVMPVDTFPKLQRLEYRGNNYMGTFISRHKNLETLCIRSGDEITVLLPIIADCCKQLKELDISNDSEADTTEYEKAVKSILLFDHLRKLNINCDDRNITKLTQGLSSLKSLESLQLSGQGDSESIPALSQLKRLQVLKLINCKDLQNLSPLCNLHRLTELRISSYERLDFNLIPMMESLINLKSLFLDVKPFKIDKKMYLRVVDVRRRRFIEIWCRIAGDDITDLLRNHCQTVKLNILE